MGMSVSRLNENRAKALSFFLPRKAKKNVDYHARSLYKAKAVMVAPTGPDVTDCGHTQEEGIALRMICP
jgi:hypothetical protein